MSAIITREFAVARPLWRCGEGHDKSLLLRPCMTTKQMSVLGFYARACGLNTQLLNPLKTVRAPETKFSKFLPPEWSREEINWCEQHSAFPNDAFWANVMYHNYAPETCFLGGNYVRERALVQLFASIEIDLLFTES